MATTDQGCVRDRRRRTASNAQPRASLVFDAKAQLHNVGTMVSCDDIHLSIVELPGFTYVSHRIRSTCCGDGIIQSADGEVCDDGNFSSADACLVSCWMKSTADTAMSYVESKSGRCASPGGSA